MPELALDLVPNDYERLDQAEASVRGYCGWHIAPSRQVEVKVPASFSSTLLLPSLHVTAVASVTTDGVEWDPEEYDWTEAGVITARCGRFSYPTTVSFTHGYADVPADITGVVQAVASRAIGNAGGLKSITRGPFSETYSTDYLSTELEILARYRIPPRP